ncbi:hypothetical protein [Wolbachia endosymbiont (group A) of Barypeithes pellucidus]|uniref:hypothetical protein n=1 Tax=Wolbachia endosymbiont (group A) of Barypeithes pellucidus TaxID=3139322 RepID=UPI003CCB4EC9
MDDFITARRKDDAVVSICQDNKKKTVLISGLNQVARDLLKYEEEIPSRQSTRKLQKLNLNCLSYIVKSKNTANSRPV